MQGFASFELMSRAPVWTKIDRSGYITAERDGYSERIRIFASNHCDLIGWRNGCVKLLLRLVVGYRLLDGFFSRTLGSRSTASSTPLLDRDKAAFDPL